MSVLQNYILPNEPKGNLSVNIEPELVPENDDIIKKILFLICDSCFWCASYYDTSNLNKVTKCPCCDNNSIESIPISHNEVYNFSYDSRRGITRVSNAERLKP